jgi:hypothetical protein
MSSNSFVYDTLRIQNRIDVLSAGHICTTTKGDLLVDNGTKTGVLPIGSLGQVLFVNSGASNGFGIEYRDPTTSDISNFTSSVNSNTNVANSISHLANTSNPHNVTATQVGLSNVQNTKVNLTATSGPLVTSDSSLGYSSGSRWVDTTGQKEYVCVSASVGAALWIQTTGGDNHNSLGGLQGGTTDQYYHVTSAQSGYLSGVASNLSGISDAATLSNKTISGSTNTLSNISNASLSSGIDAAKISSGVVSNTSFNFLSTVASTVSGNSDVATLSNKTLGDNLNMNSNTITNLATPVNNTDAANKAYVDSTVQGLDTKASVRVKTSTSLPSYSRVVNVITASANGALPTIDDVTLVATDRVLLDVGTSGSDNGIYVVTSVGSAGSKWVLTRSSDANTSAYVTTGMYVFVSEGTESANAGFSLITPDPIVLNTTSLTFTQFNGAGQINAGTGLTKSGNSLNVVGSTTILANADSLDVNSSSVANQVLLSSGTVGTSSTFGALPLSNTSSVTGVLSVANGGTNASSFSAGSLLVATNAGNTGLVTSLDPATLVSLSGIQTLSNKTISATNNTLSGITNTSISSIAAIDATKIAGGSVSNASFNFLVGAASAISGNSDSATLTNKTISASSNTLSNITNSSILSTAGIDATKIAGGTVSNASFNFLNGVASSVSGNSDAATLTNKTLTSIKISDKINDTNGNELIKFTGVSSAVNDITIQNSVTLSNPSIAASGTDSNIGLNINAKGTGQVAISNVKYPNADGTNGQVLMTNGAGVVSFSNAAGLTVSSLSTTTATLTTVQTIATVTNTVYLLDIKVVGRNTTSGAEACGIVIRATYRNSAGTLTLVGVDKISSRDNLNWDANTNISSSNIILQVTGAASTNINWYATSNITLVS